MIPTPQPAISEDASSWIVTFGAMGVSPGADSRGMLYQWGRKDPFVGTAGTSVNPFPVVYKPGYEYDYAGGRIGGNTLVYSILHPTHFITGIERDGSEGPYIGDWVIPSNPNWWGNASNGYYSDENDKSIYDPCPPAGAYLTVRHGATPDSHPGNL